MIEKGIIVSIQNYSFSTTQELVEIVKEAGAVAIRTDKPVEIDIPMIGLMKLKGKKFYITTSIKAIENLSFSTNYIAIDSRKGNKDIKKLYDFCRLHSIDIIGDVGIIEDVYNLIIIDCLPDYIATTFSPFYNDGKPNIELIEKIGKITDIPVIAEGGFLYDYQIKEAINKGAYAVCIGKAITKIYEKTKDYVNCWKEFINEKTSN